MFFGEPVRPVAVAVVDSNGVRVDLGDARSEINGRVVRTNLRPLGPGTYRVDWRVQSADSHIAEGSFTFRVTP
jgi:methionine-rich copper-binding protein CopC